MALPAGVRLAEPKVDAPATERSMTLGVHPPCRSPLTPSRRDAPRDHTTPLAQPAIPVWAPMSGPLSPIHTSWGPSAHMRRRFGRVQAESKVHAESQKHGGVPLGTPGARRRKFFPPTVLCVAMRAVLRQARALLAQVGTKFVHQPVDTDHG